MPHTQKIEKPHWFDRWGFFLRLYSPTDLTAILTYTKKPEHFVIPDTTFWRRNCNS
jgi:hypothetical protein